MGQDFQRNLGSLQPNVAGRFSEKGLYRRIRRRRIGPFAESTSSCSNRKEVERKVDVDFRYSATNGALGHATGAQVGSGILIAFFPFFLRCFRQK